MARPGRPNPIAIGMRFGRLVVVEEAPKKPRNNKRQWRLFCDCGGSAIAASNQLLPGNTQSCGCYKMERIRESKTTHGGASSVAPKHPLYATWCTMRTRCLCPTAPKYADYGGRGIKIDPRWDDFAVFVADMGPKPTPQHSIDRKDVNGDYTADNCRWATNLEQANNKRATRRLTVDGATRTIAEWARAIGARTGLISKRVRKGWSDRDAVYGKAKKSA